MAELTFEQFGLLQEAVRGTAVGAGVGKSVHQFDLAGTLKPAEEFYQPQAARGTRIRNYRSARVREWGTWSAEGDLDLNYFPVLANLCLAGGVTPTTPTNGVLTRDWLYTPSALTDDVKTGTFYFGDPNVQIMQGAFGTIDDLTISGDTTGTDAVHIALAGRTQALVPQAPTAWKAMSAGGLVLPGTIQVFVDTTSAIGTTPLNDRVVSAEHHWANGFSYKFGSGAGGAQAALSYNRIGLAPRFCEATFRFEWLDMAQYNNWKNADIVRVRTQYFCPTLIEAVTPTYYPFIRIDTYGRFQVPDYDEIESTNRGLTFVQHSMYNTSLGYDWAVQDRCTRANLTS
jgi:hypothetical protein